MQMNFAWLPPEKRRYSDKPLVKLSDLILDDRIQNTGFIDEEE